jgi:hypothetical protein
VGQKSVSGHPTSTTAPRHPMCVTNFGPHWRRARGTSGQSDGAKVMPIHLGHSVREIRRAGTDRRVADLAPFIAEPRASGVTSLRASLGRSTNVASPPWPGAASSWRCRSAGCWHCCWRIEAQHDGFRQEIADDFGRIQSRASRNRVQCGTRVDRGRVREVPRLRDLAELQ